MWKIYTISQDPTLGSDLILQATSTKRMVPLLSLFANRKEGRDRG